MNDVPDITVSELRVAIGRILDIVEVEFGEELRFPVDYYWHVMKDPYAAYDDPELGMGQVSDDASTVRNFVARPPDDDDSVVLVEECEHFAGLLHAIQHLAIHRHAGPAADPVAPADTPRPRRRPWRLRAERP